MKRGQFEFPLMGETQDTHELDSRHRFQLGGRQEIVWGGGYRLSDSELENTVEVNLSHTSRSDQIWNAFVQDKITLVPDRRRWTLDAAAFIHDYDNLRGSVNRLDGSQGPNYPQVQTIINNGVRGLTYGGELVATFQATDWWRLHEQISVIQAELKEPANSLTGASPARTANLCRLYHLPIHGGHAQRLRQADLEILTKCH